MKFGVVVGVCTKRDQDQADSIESVRKFSAPDTEVVVVFNGVDPFPLPDGIEVIHYPGLLGREQGLWKVAYDLALQRGWDWCGNFHDDFFLRESGWEQFIQEQNETYKIGIASYVAWAFIRHHNTSQDPNFVDWSMSSGDDPAQTHFKPLGVSIDGCGVVFNVHLFRMRGGITPLDVVCGYGEMEAGLWVLEQGWACVRIPLNADHHPGLSRNTRSDLNIPAAGQHETIESHLSSMPAEVVSKTEVRLGSKIIDVTWRGSPFVPVLKPSYDQAEVNAAVRVIHSGWTGSGVEVKSFEAEFAKFLGEQNNYVIGTNSCTSALHVALHACGIRKYDEVIVPPITFASTAHAVTYCGAIPVFADVDPETLCLDPESIKKIATSRTVAVIPVHLAGTPCRMEEIWKVCDELELAVIEDCAHGVGSKYQNNEKPVGSDPRSDFACFSFHAVKNLSMGDGGAVVCRDEGTARRLKSLRWCGINRDTFDRSKLVEKGYSWQYDINEIGYKYQMSEVAAAIGREQLKKVHDQNEKRRRVARIYLDAFRWLPWVQLPKVDVDSSSWHQFHIRVPNREIRDRLIDYLAERRVGTSVHYFPVNLFAAYAGSVGSTPVAHREWERLISLPMHPGMFDDNIAQVVAAVRSFVP